MLQLKLSPCSRVLMGCRPQELPNGLSDLARTAWKMGFVLSLRLLLRQFESPLVLILAFAAVISLVLQHGSTQPLSWRSFCVARYSAFSRNTELLRPLRS